MFISVDVKSGGVVEVGIQCEKFNGIVKFLFMVDVGVYLWYDIGIKGKVERKHEIKGFWKRKFLQRNFRKRLCITEKFRF